jgi:transposase-like protein
MEIKLNGPRSGIAATSAMLPSWLSMAPSPSEPSNLSALTPVQAQVVLALAQGATVTAAAAAVNLHRGTIYKWLNNQEEFEQAVREAREDYILTLRDELRDLSAVALATLRTLLTDPQTPAAVRMRLALAILERPQFPHPTWNLPEFPGSPDQEEFSKDVAIMQLDYKRLSTQNRNVPLCAK